MHFRNILVLCTLLVLPACFAHLGGRRRQDPEPTMYCGRNLARVLAGLCFGDTPDKRSDIASGSGTMYEIILSPYYKEQEPEWPWIPHSKANELTPPGARRGKRFIGVISECCDKPCSIEELMSYC